jgi:energy-coupling factor transporter ATP-binding protein EcfA2
MIKNKFAKLEVKMSHSYELFLAGSSLNTEDIQTLTLKVANHIGVFGKYNFYITFSDGIIRFFIESPKDISHISEGLSLGVLKAIDAVPTKQNSGSNFTKNRLLHLKPYTSIYQFKEEVKTKKGLDLEEVKFSIKILPMQSLITKANFLYNSGGLLTQSSLISNGFPASFIAIDFNQSKRYFKQGFPSYLNIEKALHGLVQNKTGAVLEVDGFPYFSDKRYLNLNNYQFDKHSFIIGSSGSGKSKFIELLISKISESQLSSNYKIIVIDPHSSLAEGLSSINGFKNIDFKDSSTDLFPDANSDISAATELTATLFKSLLADSYNPKVDTVLKFSLLALLTAQVMSLPNLKMFVTDLDFRNQILEHIDSYIPINVKKFFGADFNELRTKHYNDAIAPISSLVDEMQMQPAISNQDQYSLVKHIQENFLTVFSLNKLSMGEKVVKTIAGLLIQQIFLIAQSRVINEKIILFIDEVSVIQNPALAAILSEARKFNLFVILTQQYFGQIEKDLQDSILTNVSNYYVFRVSEEDARRLEGNVKISIPATVLESAKQKGQKETDLRIKILTELNPRECIFRVELNGQYLPCVKGQNHRYRTTRT